MGGGIYAALNSGRTSLQTSQKAIEITGLNIANVNTEGYSRQAPNLTPYPALNFGDFFEGTGVKVSSISRSHDVFLDGRIKEKSADVGLESSMTNPLAELERVLNIGDGSLSDEFDQFFDAWRQLSTNPSGEVERQMVLQRGQLIGNSFVNIYNETQQVVNNINTTIVSKIDGVNLNLDEIAQLNNRIATLETSGQDANSDRDRRDLLLKQLSEMIGATSYEISDHTVSVQLPNGMPLVEGTKATHIVADYTATDVNLQLEVGTTNVDLQRTSLGGEFRGLYEVRDVMIPDVVGRLDQLAYVFATEMNAAHLAGTDADGQYGRNFFVAPGEHVSQSYADPTAANFGHGEIRVNVNGTVSTITVDGTLSADGVSNKDTLNGIRAELDAITGITATINSDGALTVVADVTGQNVLIDTSAMAVGTYSRPIFTTVDMASSMTMNITTTSQVAAGGTPGSLISGGYADAAALEFGIGNIIVDINGVPTTITIDNTVAGAENNSVNGIAAAIDAVAGVSAYVDLNSNSLVVTPDTLGDTITIDASGLVGGTYAIPTFSLTDMTPGDNLNTLSILDLEQNPLAGLGGNDTLVSYYGKIASTVGVETARNRQASQGYEDSLIQLENLRDGIDGVSLEDEMINLMKFQKAFEASAKLLSTLDEMLGTLMTLKR